MAMIELFGREVIPQVREILAPVHEADDAPLVGVRSSG
jgi:hypothetical protein